ncbi:putative protein phosphatase 2C 23 [Hordeum vulgare subsp. vulgare]|nr:putative protein phosphatase 2C 23 [Hordeum vulgare subsp. vulgare]
MAAMEALEPIHQTLSEIDKRIPDTLPADYGLEKRASRSSEDAIASVFPLYLEPPHRKRDDGSASQRDGEEPQALRMNWASCYVPRHDEDAHFGLHEAGVVGVADGVGGYRKHDVDASAFSRELMRSAFQQVLAIEPGTPVCPYTLLERACEETVASGADGGSTAVILSLAGTALRWAFIGDSAFAVFRDGKVVHRSQRQQKRFNCPFHLSATGKGDCVSKADVGQMAVRHGDVVVLGTDGLFDNMFDAELEVIVRMATALGVSPKNMANVVAGMAYEMSMSKIKDSPYSTDSRRLQGGQHLGGKPDDITVVVAFIVSLYS